MSKRILTTLTALLLISILLVGCTFSKNEKEKNPSDESAAPVVHTEQGTFLGQIDNNSIEIEVKEGTEKMPKAFRLSEEIKEKFADYNLNSGDKVSFSYTTPQEGQPLLTKITKEE